MPACTVGADLELSGECALGNLAVDGGPRQPGPGKHGFQTDDTVWFAHGRAASCWLFLTAAETRQDSSCMRASAFYRSSYYGVQTAVNGTYQIPRPRPRPRSMP